MNPNNDEHLQDLKNLRVILNKGQYSGIVDENNNFVLYNIPPGQYILETTSKIFKFETILIEIPPYHPKFNQNIDVFSFNSLTRKKTKLNYPIKLYSTEIYQYFQILEPWTIWTFVKNPYMIMIGVTCVMLFLMKKMPSYEDLQQQQQQESVTQQPHQHTN